MTLRLNALLPTLAALMIAVTAQASTPQTLTEQASAALHLDPETSLAFACRSSSVSSGAHVKTLTEGLCIFDKPSRRFHLVSDASDPQHPLIFTLMPEQILSFGQVTLHDGFFVKTPVDQIQIRISGTTFIANLPRQHAFALTDAMDAAGFTRQEGLHAIRQYVPPPPPHVNAWPYYQPFGYPPYRHFYFRNW